MPYMCGFVPCAFSNKCRNISHDMLLLIEHSNAIEVDSIN